MYTCFITDKALNFSYPWRGKRFVSLFSKEFMVKTNELT